MGVASAARAPLGLRLARLRLAQEVAGYGRRTDEAATATILEDKKCIMNEEIAAPGARRGTALGIRQSRRAAYGSPDPGRLGKQPRGLSPAGRVVDAVPHPGGHAGFAPGKDASHASHKW